MDSSPGAPLMGSGDHVDDEIDTIEPDDHDEPPAPGLYVWLLTFAAGISGLLFGCESLSIPPCRHVLTNPPDDTGVISAALVSIGTTLSDRPLTTYDKSILTSSTALFALFASPVSSLLADRLGRQRIILLADILFILGAILQAQAASVATMVYGRMIVGLAIGAASFVTPMYISEIAPARYRGRLVTLNVLFITFGQVVAYVVGWVFAEYAPEATGWRWMVGLGAAPAVVQGLVVAVMPETPRWLVRVGRREEAKEVVRRVAGRGPGSMRFVEGVVRDIEVEMQEERDARLVREQRVGRQWKHLSVWNELVNVGRNRRALIITCLLQGLQQLSGFVSLLILYLFTIAYVTNPSERHNVLLRHNLPNGRLQPPNNNEPQRSHNKLHLHSPGPPPNRPHRPAPHPPLLSPNNVPRPPPRRLCLSLHNPPPLPLVPYPLPHVPGCRKGRSNSHPPQHDALRSRIRHRAGQRALDAERAVPVVC